MQPARRASGPEKENTAVAREELQRFIGDFDPLDPELGSRLWEVLAEMREHCPVAHSDRHGGFWVLTRYADVYRALQDWRTFSSASGVVIPQHGTDHLLPPLETDPPEQREWRKIYNPHFSPGRVARYGEGIRAIATEYLDRFTGRGHCDLVAEFAVPFPAHAFLELVLGVPPEEIPSVQPLCVVISSSGEGPELESAFDSLAAWVSEFLDRRQQSPRPDDVVSALLDARIGGHPISHKQLVRAVMLLILGGLDTTTYAIGNIGRHLAEQPELADWLRHHPESIEAAVEEFLRFEAPSAYLARSTTRDVVVDGQLIPKGDTVALYWISANRDPARFDDPDHIDFDRQGNRHLSFGLGMHFCTGANLARLELKIVLEELLLRLPGMRLADGAEISYKCVHTTRGPLSLPVVFEPSPAVTSRTRP